jgi:hypothetical protein
MIAEVKKTVNKLVQSAIEQLINESRNIQKDPRLITPAQVLKDLFLYINYTPDGDHFITVFGQLFNNNESDQEFVDYFCEELLKYGCNLQIDPKGFIKKISLSIHQRAPAI